MNRYRMRFAPQVWTPSLSPTLVKWLRPFRERKRQSEVNVYDIDIRGEQVVRHQLDQGNGVLIMPNHASHADPYVIYAGADKVGTALHIMATMSLTNQRSSEWPKRWTSSKKTFCESRPHRSKPADRQRSSSANQLKSSETAKSKTKPRPSPRQSNSESNQCWTKWHDIACLMATYCP